MGPECEEFCATCQWPSWKGHWEPRTLQPIAEHSGTAWAGPFLLNTGRLCQAYIFCAPHWPGWNVPHWHWPGQATQQSEFSLLNPAFFPLSFHRFQTCVVTQRLCPPTPDSFGLIPHMCSLQSISSCIYVGANGIISFFLWLSSIPLCICTTSSLWMHLLTDI